MSNKRELKRVINYIASNLFAECIAASLYGNSDNEKEVNELLSTIVVLQDNYLRRVSHVEPGMPAKQYFNDLKVKFNKEVGEIIDNINNLS